MSTDIRVMVDRVIAVEKKPVGVATWIDEHREGDKRLRYPLLIEGEVSDATLTIIAYPWHRALRFRLVLSYTRAIWRVDYTDDEVHVNSFDKPDDVLLGPFSDPHYHAWQDNRRFASAAMLPDRLENARLLDANLKTFDNAFRWFCGQTTIDITELGVPSLPTTDRLL